MRESRDNLGGIQVIQTRWHGVAASLREQAIDMSLQYSLEHGDGT